MSDTHADPSGPVRIGLVGATGLIGRRLIEISSAGEDVRMVGIARREPTLPKGAKVEMFVADPEKWGEVLGAVKPAALICALGTTWKKAGRDEAAFRAVDYDLIVNTARTAHEVGISNFVMVSSSGADARSKSFYMRTKGETEQAVSKIGLKRVDILRPGLLKGARIDDLRPLEAAAQFASPILDPLLPRKWSGYRSIDADAVCEAAIGLALRKAAGRFTHDNDAIKRAARDWRAKASFQDE
ncbi:NAD(P)H-binding protein [Qipengyuania sp. S6317L1]|uniref:NAD(P)H-binding protein n=1 Tax=Qipengyuania sp. S6317L1 TaxID=2926410 RepID=UPI001FF3CD98|nr:NAD(P)H-binding protein [Qipengyuania sp. S6317L1]MCK0100189.1 NAD(P)H-binding protein [Qipengyuania sp. S6317L1]